MSKEEKAEVEVTVDLYKALSATFPQGAYSIDDSRGMTLIGLKGAWVVERLNSVFGLLGDGWRYSHSSSWVEEFKSAGGYAKKEILVSVMLQWKLRDGTGTFPVLWDSQNEKFVYGDGLATWSEPIPSTGGNMLRKGGTPMSDAIKGAVTNALSKAASKVGVGIQAYKGMLEVDGKIVSVAGEDSLEETLGNMRVLTNDLLKLAMKIDPEHFEDLRVIHPYVADYFKEFVLNPLYEYIVEHKLGEFVKDNLNKILHDGSVEFGGMSLAGAEFLASMLFAIVGESVSWSDALTVAEKWDRKTSWSKLYKEWPTTKEVE